MCSATWALEVFSLVGELGRVLDEEREYTAVFDKLCECRRSLCGHIARLDKGAMIDLFDRLDKLIEKTQEVGLQQEDCVLWDSIYSDSSDVLVHTFKRY